MPKIVDHDQRRAQIAEAAARIIAERGIDAVTMVAIGEAAGVTTGAVTHYFQEKDEVILAALRWSDSAMQARAARAFQEHEDPVSIALAALPSDRQGRIEWLVWSVFSDRATRDETLIAEQRARDREWQTFAESALRELRAQGLMPEDLDVEVEASLTVALIDGIGFNAAWDPEAWPEERQRRVLQQYFDRLRSP